MRRGKSIGRVNGHFKDIGGGYATAQGGQVWFQGERVNTAGEWVNPNSDGFVSSFESKFRADSTDFAGQALHLEHVGLGYAMAIGYGRDLIYLGHKVDVKGAHALGKAVVIDANWIRFGPQVYFRRGEQHTWEEAKHMGCNIHAEGDAGLAGNADLTAGFLVSEDQSLGNYSVYGNHGNILYK
jgi:hypothetical protein